MKPVDSIIQSILNVSTAGGLRKKLKENDVTTLVHPFATMYLSGVRPLVWERVARIEMSNKLVVGKDDRCFGTIDISSKNLTVGQMIQNHADLYGGTFDSILKYDPRHRNSQIFILDFLNANGINSGELEKFYKQPTEEIMKEFEATNKLVAKVNLLGASLSYLIGQGA